MSAGATINQNGAGTISTTYLGVTAPGGAALLANNAVANLELSTTTNTAFALTDLQDLAVLGAVNTGTGNLTLTSGGAINLYAPVTGATVDLVSGGAIGQNNAGTIMASTLTGSSQGSAILLAQNAITNLGSFSTNNNPLALTNAQNLTIDGAVNLGTSYAEFYTGGTLNETGAGAITALGDHGFVRRRHDAEREQCDRLSGRLHDRERYVRADRQPEPGSNRRGDQRHGQSHPHHRCRRRSGDLCAVERRNRQPRLRRRDQPERRPAPLPP